MEALYCVGELAGKVGTADPYAWTVLQTESLIAPEYGEVAMNRDESLGSVYIGLKVVIYVAHTSSSIATKVDDVCVYRIGDSVS